MYPGAHAHEYPFARSVHSPPLSHGFGSQSSMSTRNLKHALVYFRHLVLLIALDKVNIRCVRIAIVRAHKYVANIPSCSLV